MQDELIVIFTAALPVSELRGAIPLAILTFSFSPAKSYILALVGNLVPVIPLLLFLEPVSSRLRRFRMWRGFFDWLFERTRRRGELVQRYEAIGLALFVSIPLPVTGAWTGCVAASLFKIKFKYAFPAIVAGVGLAGIIVTAITLGGARLLLAWSG